MRLTLGTLMTLVALAAHAQEADMAPIRIHNDYAELRLRPDARGVELVDLLSRTNCAQEPGEAPFAIARIGGEVVPATDASYADGRLRLAFGEGGVTATIGVRPQGGYFILQVLAVEGDGVEELTFCDVALTLKGDLGEPFAACVLALNLQTNVREFPGPSRRLLAHCYDRFGLAGARAALIACPTERMREVMKQAVSEAPDLPHSPCGGPWALDGPLNRSSYLFNFDGITEQTVDAWIAKTQSIGYDQIQFHGGSSFRFGDCRLNPDRYPEGLAGLRRVTDRLHAAGIAVGMQPYAFFIDKRCPWVTPVPHPGLAKDASFTLAGDLPAEATDVPVVESTEAMSAITGFFVRNSVTLQIDDELIAYTGIHKAAPYAFTGCQRGALGTRASAHAQGAEVHHLKECFGLFAPDPESPLFEEVAARNAKLFNEGGFDAIYFDALDGEDVLAGSDVAWHYGSRYVFEVWKRLRRPAVMEMSTFHHHLWYVRSRMGAWDHPNRSHRHFVDLHVADNQANDRMFLPSNLGWWAFKSWGGSQTEPTFPEDIEYLCCKAIGTDSGLSCTTYNENAPGQQRLADTMRRYEMLRRSGAVPQDIKDRLREPGADFALESGPGDEWRLRPARYEEHKVTGLDDGSDRWQVTNEFGSQAPGIRVEALLSAGPYDAPDNPVVMDFADPSLLSDRAAADGVTMQIEPSAEVTMGNTPSGKLTARSTRPKRRGAWAKMGRIFEPALNLAGHEFLGLWIHGDGKGEVLNFQLRSPQHISHGIADHYVVVDFTGWRYIELIEPEGKRHADYVWPYGGSYAMYREIVHFPAIETVAIWVNELPPGEEIACYLSPIRAVVPLEAKVVGPVLSVAGQALGFPTDIPSGHYLEFRGMDDCKLYGPQGEVVAAVAPQGDPPVLPEGESEISLAWGTAEGAHPRAKVTVMTRGEPL